MSGSSIGALTAVSAVGTLDLVPVTQGYTTPGTGVTKKATIAQIAAGLAITVPNSPIVGGNGTGFVTVGLGAGVQITTGTLTLNLGTGLTFSGGALTTVGQQFWSNGIYAPGGYLTSQQLYAGAPGTQVVLQSGSAGYYAGLDVAPTGTLFTGSIVQNAATIGSYTVASGAVVGSATITATTTLAAADVLKVFAPVNVDGTAAGLRLTLTGKR